MTDSGVSGNGWQLYLDGLQTPRRDLIDEGPPGSPRPPTLMGASVDERLVPSASRRIVTRVFDVTVACVLVIVNAPILAVAAILIRATSPGPALFRQERVGHAGRLFTVLKFRTMDVDAEAKLAALVAVSERFRRGLEDEMKPFEDSRITPIGNVLRRHCIDELPQLLNVLRGEMSIVGPRPFLPIEAARFGDALPALLAVKPGLTGLWQVSGRNDLGFAGRIRLDLEYVHDNSLRQDIAICFRTLPVVLRGSDTTWLRRSRPVSAAAQREVTGRARDK